MGAGQAGFRRSAQRHLYRALTPTGPALEQRLWDRIPDDWRLEAFRARFAHRGALYFPRLASLVPPRVLAAVLRLWFRGWCTVDRGGPLVPRAPALGAAEVARALHRRATFILSFVW